MKVVQKDDFDLNPDSVPQVKITNPADQYFGQILNVITSIDDLGVRGVIVETPNGDEWFYDTNEVEIFTPKETKMFPPDYLKKMIENENSD